MPEQRPIPNVTERSETGGPAAGDTGGIAQPGSSDASASSRLGERLKTPAARAAAARAAGDPSGHEAASRAASAEAGRTADAAADAGDAAAHTGKHPAGEAMSTTNWAAQENAYDANNAARAAADFAGEAAERAGRHPADQLPWGQLPGGGAGPPPAPGNRGETRERSAYAGKLIQVGNLPDSLDAAALRGLFEPHGSVRSATINRHLRTGRSTGVGFVEMEFADDGTAAIAALNQRQHMGRVLSVCSIETEDRQAEDGPQMFGPMNMADGGVPAEGSD